MSRLNDLGEILEGYTDRKYKDKQDILPGKVVMPLQYIVDKVSAGDEDNMRQGFLMGEKIDDVIYVKDIVVPNQGTGSAVTKVTEADLIGAMVKVDEMRHFKGYEFVGLLFYTNKWKPNISGPMKLYFDNMKRINPTMEIFMVVDKNLDFVLKRKKYVPWDPI